MARDVSIGYCARQLKRTAQKLERLARTWDLHDLEERSPGEFVAQPGAQLEVGKRAVGLLLLWHGYARVEAPNIGDVN